MSTTLSFLPPPKHAAPAAPAEPPEPVPDLRVATKTAGPPPYGERHGFLPRTAADYGDGGAFPEIPMLQYPLDMGRDKTKPASTTVALQVDAEGNLRYDALARHGHAADTVVHSQYRDLVPMEKIPDNAHEVWAKPSEEELERTTEATKLALQQIVDSKLSAAKPKTIASTAKPGQPVFVKYTPTERGGKSGSSRIIRIVEAPVDPLEPPRFGFKRLPPGPPSPPPPVMRSPPRKLTKEDHANWRIPPCISNWKNAKGYTIPLDKRLAADGRGLQEVVVNDNFAKFSEALMIAERHAREEVRTRATMQQKMADKERALKEERLRQLAQQAREERSGIARPAPEGSSEDEDDLHDDGDDPAAAREREAMRRDKQRQLQREYRMAHMGADAKARHAKTLAERDASEKMALGLSEKPKFSSETMFDSRLFNQSAGLSSGFGAEDAYDVYDRPLFTGAHNPLSSVYRPSAGRGDDDMYGGATASVDYDKLATTDRFVPAKGFTGTSSATAAAPRDGPVEFVRGTSSSAPAPPPPAKDVFGVSDFMSQATRKSARRGSDADDDGDRRGGGSSKRGRYD